MNYIKSSVVLAGLAAAVAWADQNPCSGVKVTKHVTVINGGAMTNLSASLGAGSEGEAAIQDALAGLVAQARNGANANLAQALADAGLGSAPASGSTPSAAAGPHAWLGVGTDEIGDDVRSLLPEGVVGGLIVRHVDEDSPAGKAGIQVNDILVKLDDQILVTPDQLRRLVGLRKEGDKAALTGLRKGKEVKFDASLAMKEDADVDAGVHVISFGGLQPDIKMELPPEFRKLMESGGATVFSTSIVIRSQGGLHSGGPGSGTRLHKSGGSSSSKSSTGISASTVNGKTTITYNGEEVFSGTTAGAVSTKAVNNNGQEYAAAFDGDKVIWESKPGAAEKLKN